MCWWSSIGERWTRFCERFACGEASGDVGDGGALGTRTGQFCVSIHTRNMAEATAPEVTMSQEDLAEAFFLHPADHPGLLLVSKPFDGSSFGSWKRTMLIALSTKGKLCFIDGSFPKPQPASSNFKKWLKTNDMVMSWILNVLAKPIADSVIYAKTARQMWLELEERFSQVNGAKLYQVKKAMCNISQGADDVATYYTKMKSLWDELDDLDEIPLCTCTSADKMHKREQNQKLLQFLMGLNDDYNSIRGTILMMIPLPTISQVYSMLIQEEKQREIRSTGLFLADSASLVAESHRPQQPYKGRVDRNEPFSGKNPSYDQGRFDKNEGKKTGLFCNYCKKPGHVIEKCFRLHGFPPNPRFRGGRRTAALVQTGSQEPSTYSQDSVVPPSTVVPGLTAEQSSQLVALLQNVQLNQSHFNSSTSPDIASVPGSTAFSSFAGPFTEEASGSW